MDTRDRVRQHALAIMLVGVQISIVGLAIGTLLVVLAGTALTIVLFFVKFWEGAGP